LLLSRVILSAAKDLSSLLPLPLTLCPLKKQIRPPQRTIPQEKRMTSTLRKSRPALILASVAAAALALVAPHITAAQRTDTWPAYGHDAAGTR
jgi:hypothetical protein